MDAPSTNGEQHKKIPADSTVDKDQVGYRSAVPVNDDRIQEKASLAQQADPTALNKIIQQQAGRIEKLEHELAQAKKLATQSARVQAEFMDTMSHELRTPLNGILGMTQLIMDMPLSSEARDHLKTIDESGQHLASIIEQILDYVHLTQNKVSLAVGAFHLETALNEIINPYISEIYQKNLDLALDYDFNDGIEVFADQKRVQQIVAILLDNAVKFTTKGHISVYVTSRQAENDGNHSAPAQELVIRVADTGSGIKKSAQELIFFPFRQIDGSMKRQHGGIGLGLALCAEVVSLMAGDIEIESSEGTGSVFTITVPIEVVPSSQKQEYPPFSPTNLGVICNLNAQRKTIEQMVKSWDLNPVVWQIDEEGEPETATPQASAWIVEYEPDHTRLKEVIGGIVSGTHPARPFVIALIAPGVNLSLNERALFEVVIEKPLRRKNLYEALSFGFNAKASNQKKLKDFNSPTAPTGYLLLIEPNRINQKVLLRILENLAINVDVVDELDQVADTWPESHYDAILINPACDTSEDMAKLRDFAWAVQKDGGPRLVALAPKEGHFTPDRLKAAGISHHLVMPVNLQALRDAIGLAAL